VPGGLVVVVVVVVVVPDCICSDEARRLFITREHS
jgi:hypothetical protein